MLSDDPGSSARISEFAESTSRWLVAVRMVSEGVDVPRLAVGIYATSASTPLFFAQAVGRFVRSRRPGETASIFLPSVPNLLQLASELEAQRNHVLGEPHRARRAIPWTTTRHQEQNEKATRRASPRWGRRGTGSGHLRRIVVRHRHPGRQRRGGRLSRHPRPARRRADARPAAPPTGRAAAEARRNRPGTAHPDHHPRTAARLRRELNALVSVAHHRTGKPHGWIHNELRRRCGGPPIAAATRDQLKDASTPCGSSTPAA